MKQSRFTDEQIIGFLKQADAGMSVKELCRSGGFSQPRKLPCQVDNLKLEISLTNFLGMNSIGATSPRDSCGLNSL